MAGDHLRRRRHRRQLRVPARRGHAVVADDPQHGRPEFRLGVSSVEFSAGVISAADVATVTVEAVRSGRFMVLPHAELLDMYRHKGGDYDRWIAGMRRYQRTLRGV